MKKLLLLFVAFIVMQLTYGQLTGVKTIPGDYATIEAAIAALNSQGVGAGGVTFNVAAGHTETLSSATGGTITTNTATSSNQIIFQKSGGGANPVITAAVLASASATDGIIKIAGTDYVTFDGINLQENAGNTTNLTDWGYAILKESAANGSQNITIKNCTITLNKTNTSSVGIYSNNHTATSTTAITGITTLAGTNSFNKVFSNTISNSYLGIYVYGFADVSPYSYYDQNNEIGVNGGNNISDFGGAATTMYGLYTIYQNNLQVSNNTVTGTIGGTTTIYGIYLSTAVNANSTISGNIVNFVFTGTTQSAYGLYIAAGGTGTNNTINLTNNTISINYSSATTGVLYAVYHSASCYNFNCSYNNITNNLLGSASTAGTGTFGGLYTFGSNTNAGSLWNIDHNTISGNIRAQSALSTGTNYYLYNSSSGVTCNIFNNSITNNAATSTSTSYCIYSSSSAITKNIYDNQVNNLINANSTAYGIYNSSGTTISIYRNMVQNLNSNSTGSVIYGIQVSSGTTGYVYNNYVSELKTPIATGNPAIYGISIAGGTNMYGYFNTIYLNAVSSGSSFGSTGIYGSTTPNIDFRNNLVVNVSTPGATGRTVAHQRSSSTLTSYASTANNNDYYAGTPSASNLIYYDGTNSDQTLATYKVRVTPRETFSVSENPPFMNIVTSPYNLHIMTSVNTQIESAGTSITNPPIDIVNDFDLDARYPNVGYPNNAGSPATAPDIGADEFGGLAQDLTPPNIIFTPLVNTSSTGARTLTTAITDASGVPTAGIGLPVLYWKINSGAYSPVTATFVSGSTYTFTFGSGVVLGDVISYYIVAQDILTPIPNVGANPSGGASGYTYNPPACSTPPSSPFIYNVVSALSGTYPVGVGQVYPTITAAVADLNFKDVVGPVTFELWDATYPSETFPLINYAYAGMDASRPVTFKPKAGISPIITGSSTTGIWVIYGADYITINGSNSGGTDRSLTIENTNNAASTYVLGIFNNGSRGAQHNTIKNCVVKAGGKVNNTWAIILNAAGGDFDYTTIQNNQLLNAMVGMQFVGVNTGITNNGVIQDNIFGSTDDALTLGNVGLNVSFVDGLIIKNNTIQNLKTNTNPKGINISTNSLNTTIDGNIITGIIYTGTGGYGGKGIDVNTGSATSNLVITNNAISQIKGDGWSTFSSDAIVGIRLLGSTGGINIYHNSINLTGALDRSGATNDVSAALYVVGTATNLNVRDNILVNSMENTTGVATAYSIYSDAANTAFNSINYNDYWVSGPEGVLGYIGASQRTTLSAWQTGTGQDVNSLNVDPVFISSTDLHASAAELDNAGIYLTAVQQDITGANRTNPPDMGAYEFGTNPTVATAAATTVNCGGATLNGTINANGLTVNSYFDYGLTTAYGSSVAGTPATVTGSAPTAISATLSLPQLTTYHYRLRGVTSGGVTVYGQDMMFTTTAAGAPTASTLTATGIGPTYGTVNGNVNAMCANTTVTFEYGLTNTYGYSVNATPYTVTGGLATPVSAPITGLVINTTYHYRVKAVSSNGTTYGSDLTFTTGGMPPTVTTNAASNIDIFGARLNGTVNANEQSSTVVFEIGTGPDYGNIYTAVPGTVTGNTPTAVYYDISGLGYNTTYHYRCVATNIGGTTYGNDMTFTTLCPDPLAPTNLQGPTSICQGTGGHVYYVDPIYYATGYTWTLPAGGVITSGANTNIITVSYANNAVSGDVSVYGINECGSGPVASIAVTLNPIPVPTINGPTTACVTSTYTYSTQAGNTGYVWAVSAGGQIMTGAGTNTVTVKWNNSGNQWVSATYTSPFGCPAASPTTINVTVGTLPSPSIAGNDKSCLNDNFAVYTTQTGYTGYNWTVSNGGTIVSGQGTYQIEVDWTSPGNKTVSVNYASPYGCFASTPATFNVQVTPPPPPAGQITGTHDVCAGEMGVSYSVNTVPNATNYVWNVPAGATIVEGEGTNEIVVDFAGNAQSGNISVYAENVCGAGQASPPYAVTVNPIPPTPEASVDEFFVLHSTALIGNQWYFNGTLIEGATNPDYQAEAEGVYYTVVTVNGCSSEPSNEVNVIFTGIGELDGSSFSIFPIPNDGKFTATIVIKGDDIFTIRVVNELGSKVFEKTGIHVDGKAQEYIDLNNPGKGIYSVIFQGGDQTVIRKVLVTK